MLGFCVPSCRLRLGAGLLGSALHGGIRERLGLGVGGRGLRADLAQGVDEPLLVRPGGDALEPLGEGVEVLGQHVLVPDDGGLVRAFLATVGLRFLRLDLLLARRELEPVGLAVGQVLEQVLAGLPQHPAAPVPHLESQPLGGGALDDELRQRARAVVLTVGRQQRLGGQLGQDVRDVRHAGVLAAGRTQVVHQVLVGLSDGLGGLRLQHPAETPDVTLGHLGVRVLFQVPLLDQVGPQGVLVVQLHAQHAPHDSAHVTRTSIVEADPQRLEGVDGLLVGSDLVDLHVAGAPKSVHGRADGAPAFVDGQLVRLEGLTLGGEDQLHALVHGRDLLASDRSDHQPVRTARVALATLAASAPLVLLAEQGDEAAVNGRVTTGGQLEQGAAIQVVGHGLDELAVLRVGLVLHPPSQHDLVPELDGAVTGQRQGHGLVDGVAVAVRARLPGPGVDVADEEAEHAAHAVEDGLAMLDLDLAVGEDALATVADHQG